MKIKKARKMLKKLGVDEVLIRENGREPDDHQKDTIIPTDKSHSLDDAEIVSTTLGYDDFEITYEKPSSKKEKKKKKKEMKKSAYDDEIGRIQRNLKNLKHGGPYEESQEEIDLREEKRQEQLEKQRRYPARDNKVNQNTRPENREESNNPDNREVHHQNREANQRNRQRSNGRYRRQQNPSSDDSGTNQVTRPENSEKKEE